MNSHIVKLIILSCLLFQSGCDIRFKKQATNNKSVSFEKSKDNKKTYKNVSVKSNVGNKDFDIIISYYSDKANANIRKDMIMHTEISDQQAKKMVVGKIIPREIQVMPLPLALERILTRLPLHVIRVQVGTRVIYMNVKSRKILEIIKI